jgi:hypothetical protein
METFQFMQIAVATPKVQSYSVSQQERQPQQLKLEASVADSFTPSVVQERSGANFKKVAPLGALLLFLGSCAQQVEKKAAPVVEKAVEHNTGKVEEKVGPSANLFITKIKKSTLYKTVEPMSVKLPTQGNNEATTSASPDFASLSAKQKNEIGYRTIKVLSCNEKDGKFSLAFNTGKPLVNFKSIKDCEESQLKTTETLMNRGSITFPDSIVDLQQQRGSTGTNGLFINLIQGEGFGENPLEGR